MGAETFLKTITDISLILDGSYVHQTPDGVKNVQLEFELIKDYPGGAGQQVRAVRMRLHHGTHVDAPMHFVPGGAAINEIPIERFCGPVVLVDLTPIGDNEQIRPEHLEKGLAGRNIAGQRVLIRTDWNKNYGKPDYAARAPYLGPAAVDWLASRKPVLVGYDCAHSKDAPDSPAPDYAVRTFLENGIITMGYVRNLDQVDPARDLTLVALPLAFANVEASPVRAVVIQS
ncbi:MAG TPA: cyclase family protein [Trebonia sp.]|nr:cyclase family protein [Trebonia sp.]